MTVIVLFMTLGMGVLGWIVIGVATTDPGPRGQRLMRVGFWLVGVALALATIGAVGAWIRG